MILCGWLWDIEQGGCYTRNKGVQTITLKKAFKDTNYTVVSNAGNGTDTGEWPTGAAKRYSTTQIQTMHFRGGVEVQWYACGY